MPYKEETAGRLASCSVPIALKDETAGTICKRLRSHGYDTVDLICVVDSDGRYEGVVELRAVFEADDTTPMGSLVKSWPSVLPQTDQEHAAECASVAGVAHLPVVSEAGRLIGVITPIALLDVLAKEHHEDVNRFTGILKDRANARHALEDPPLQRVARRLPWLLIGLAMSSSAVAVMASFEAVLEANVLIAFFIPALVYLTDAIGTQTEAIAVRGLSLRKRPLADILASELVTGALIGLTLGLLSVLGVWATFGNLTVGLGIGLSLFAGGTLASGIGLLLPWGLSRLNIDPAFGSGPVATILQDALTILIYFIVMKGLF